MTGQDAKVTNHALGGNLDLCVKTFSIVTITRIGLEHTIWPEFLIKLESVHRLTQLP